MKWLLFIFFLMNISYAQGWNKNNKALSKRIWAAGEKAASFRANKIGFCESLKETNLLLSPNESNLSEIEYAALYDDIVLAQYELNKIKNKDWQEVTSKEFEDNFYTTNLIVRALIASSYYDAGNVLNLLLSDNRLNLSSDDFTFLIAVAAQCGSRRSLSALIKAGADANSEVEKYRPFSVAIVFEYADFALDLIRYGYTGCDENGEAKRFKARTELATPHKDYTYKEYALAKGYKEISEMLPECKPAILNKKESLNP